MNTSKTAIIDIGSNSVRFVIFDELKRTPLPLHNEKVLCGLARGMGKTGMLNEEGAELAFNALGRFAHILKAMKINRVSVFATSAVRDAIDGEDFIKRVKSKYNFQVRILSEDEEAEFSAIGVISSMDKVDGVSGDFGGGSLELTKIIYEPQLERKNFIEAIGARKSFPIGALRLKSQTNNNKVQAKNITDKFLNQFEINKHLKDKTFYAIGGGFRALAKYHIDRTNYPLDIIHQYQVPADKLQKTIKYVATMTIDKIKATTSFPVTRSDTISYTALVLERIIELGQPRNIVFSTHGVREGLLVSSLPKEVQKKDALLDSVSGIIKYLTPGTSEDWVKFGHELYDWMTPLFRNEDNEIKRLRLAACILSRLAWHEHTGYRAEMAFRWVLDSAIPAIDHKGRVFVATSVFHRYKTEPLQDVLGEAQSLLPNELIFRARVIGNAMRLGYAIAGGALGVLEKTPINLTEDKQLVLSAAGEEKILFGTQVRQRIDKLANLTGLKSEVRHC